MNGGSPAGDPQGRSPGGSHPAARSALVTGVGRRAGIGYAIARRLGDAGWGLMLQSWSRHDAEQPWGADPVGPEGVVRALQGEIPDARIAHVEADFTDIDIPAVLIREATEAFGHLDALVVNHAHSSDQSLGELEVDEIDRALIVNVRATLMLVKWFHAAHDGRPGGRIILAGQHRGTMPWTLPYIAGKGALHQLTPTLASAVADKGITLNCVDPGATNTGWATPEVHADVLASEPFGRWGEPDDAARLIAFLCSEEARWITGQVITSSGGGP
jgi:3-oxoacyl-[acyl-carrier protein] reductase